MQNMGRLNTQFLAVVHISGKAIDPLFELVVNFCRFAQHHRQHMVTGNHFSKMHIGVAARLEAQSFEFCHVLGRQGIVQIFGDRIGIGHTHCAQDIVRNATRIDRRGAQP